MTATQPMEQNGSPRVGSGGGKHARVGSAGSGRALFSSSSRSLMSISYGDLSRWAAKHRSCMSHRSAEAWYTDGKAGGCSGCGGPLQVSDAARQ